MGANLWILVWVGEPLDYPRYRHAAIYVEFDDRENRNRNNGTLFHVIGTLGLFDFRENPGYNPAGDSTLRKKVEVGRVPDQVSPPTLRSVLAVTNVRNSNQDADWNCQNWVGDALRRLVGLGWLSSEQMDVALDAMVDACLEAEDTEY